MEGVKSHLNLLKFKKTALYNKKKKKKIELVV